MSRLSTLTAERDEWRAKLEAFAKAVGVSFLDQQMKENCVGSWRLNGATILRYEEQMRDEVKRQRERIAELEKLCDSHERHIRELSESEANCRLHAMTERHNTIVAELNDVATERDELRRAIVAILNGAKPNMVYLSNGRDENPVVAFYTVRVALIDGAAALVMAQAPKEVRP